MEVGTLYQLACLGNVVGFQQARLMALPRPQAVQELLYRNHNYGWTVLHRGGFWRDASLELVRAICDVMRDDPLKTNLFTIADNFESYPLHWCACYATRVEALQFVIDKFPHALVRRNQRGNIPLFFAQSNNTNRSNHSSILRCIEDNTAKYPALLNPLTVKCCLVRMKKEGMTAIVAATPLNEQTPGQFVYELLDMMINSEMKSMAEDIISYVGVGAIE